MKKIVTLLSVLLLAGIGGLAQVGINATNSAPDPSAGLDVNFTNKGILPPRVSLTSTANAAPVLSPAAGLLVYNTAVAGSPPWNVLPGYYCWGGTKWIAVTAPDGTSAGDMLYWNGTQWVRVPVGSNGQVLTMKNGIPVWSDHAASCGYPITIYHVAGAVAPVSKTITYATVSNIPGEPLKCWISSNLGADHQATSVNDATEASAGWYWQFNRKQGYKHDGSLRTPNTPWNAGISENSDWIAANDPCTLELGIAWRIPTVTEWFNVDASGNWNNWNDEWNSTLKMHAAGYLYYADGTLVNRGANGVYWSSVQADLTYGDNYGLTSGSSLASYGPKSYGTSMRCLKDY